MTRRMDDTIDELMKHAVMLTVRNGEREHAHPDSVLATASALTCLLTDRVRRPDLAQPLNEAYWPLGTTVLLFVSADFDLTSATEQHENKTPPAHICAELICLLKVLCVRISIDSVCLVNALHIVERLVAMGIDFTRTLARPLTITALLLACKEHFDEVVTIDDFKSALPRLHLDRLGTMERHVLCLLEHQVTIFDDVLWSFYVHALCKMFDEHKEELAVFLEIYEQSISAVWQADLADLS
mmetsp:Transcript_39777/g.65944  ORF Transcript_39777/g.65944 Transcript_39777/m.65944 type:complete len:241 (+) Transcript_39777:37-759(+)|eukprot:CAMPEP_0119335390 /NCGR_PEP_ID=MMETSP1333-20130426/89487_1 /TAXON_ID=418940 /ORGANISM="Scyphosphaera apsteinii, Strain RCC1455" /LENGTH=240 /DNA_ID=CAMNT_0007345933 /DNA_START=25 /DNA_END=747 /DNA_ORIENTATION=-